MIENENTRTTIEDINTVFDDTLVRPALEGLPTMFLPGESAFCEIARYDSRQKIVLSGLSLRYTAMSLIGLTLQESLGRSTALPLDAITDRLADWCAGDISPGDGGLVLWALALRNDGRAEPIARVLIDRMTPLLQESSPFSSMGLGWFLTGVSVAIQKQIAPDELRSLAGQIYAKLKQNRSEETGLFSLATPGFRKNIFLARMNAQLGSFASQVYPVIGLSYYSTAQQNPEALQIAQKTCDQLCRLQGEQGQWWWIYHVKTAQPAIRYPVYGVHQDAMGPMALLAARLAGYKDEKLLTAVQTSLRWLHQRDELAEEAMIDPEKSVVWRAIQRDDPGRTGGFGLGLGERVRMVRSAWLGGADTRPFSKGYVCRECRPYHLGWILYAAALARELQGAMK